MDIKFRKKSGVEKLWSFAYSCRSGNNLLEPFLISTAKLFISESSSQNGETIFFCKNLIPFDNFITIPRLNFSDALVFLIKQLNGFLADYHLHKHLFSTVW